jgi:hypothetical protein
VHPGCGASEKRQEVPEDVGVETPGQKTEKKLWHKGNSSNQAAIESRHLAIEK